ncbi:TniQ family protein [Arthrobacter sp. U41]|uniref:TniQ family protein n=1 Tax=Arthrobacter sp. U41 TaxID=1849032 RepID=UPI0008593649|nr:TniQ family protein [Arthrobacter sp. U41]AOT03649.1 hypothetical protein ASPU41_10220 [Arthrobacter sp. U41]
MPPPRWPLHPAPAEAEALSSWLNRLAGTYRMDTSALLEHGLGQGRIQDRQLDENPPATLLTELARCSGVGRELPLMLSCPRHGRRIETYEGLPPDYLRWTSATSDPPSTRDAVTLMDRRTWQAITTGSVDLPRRRVHAGIWFRLLRTLLDELSTAQGRYGRQLAEVRLVWEYCGHPFRAGMHAWRPFENLHWEKQKQLLEAAAAGEKLISR